MDQTKLREFAEMVARMHIDGEYRTTGEEYEQTIEDAYGTLSNLIEAARKITGVKPADLADEEVAHG